MALALSAANVQVPTARSVIDVLEESTAKLPPVLKLNVMRREGPPVPVILPFHLPVIVLAAGVFVSDLLHENAAMRIDNPNKPVSRFFFMIKVKRRQN